jgi:hypothetical protein
MRPLLVAAAAFGVAGAAHAATPGFEASGGVSLFDADDVSLTAVTGRAAYVFHPNFGVEGELSLGIDGDEVGGAEVELDRALGLFAVGYLPLTEGVNVFGRVGFTDTEVEASAGPFSARGDADGIGFGVGATANLASNFGLRGDYAQYEGDGDDYDVFSFTAAFKF